MPAQGRQQTGICFLGSKVLHIWAALGKGLYAWTTVLKGHYSSDIYEGRLYFSSIFLTVIMYNIPGSARNNHKGSYRARKSSCRVSYRD